ncbi:tripartite tricarboxylate transporter TctB family protein [Brachyspira hampsonii]|uniref:DUF1468 domain-containing protein n=1 Tax=Brachyspira hampsonii TaxID=1287055 RepID=A0AAC9TVS5_9SPIR|nr:tripartite tricarboxylate transporter TctB family protein [Brachyspira hampsonii]ASJ21789.1 hypothetical protein BHAMNSH16_09090 [Brachyspira hampsonii]ELV05068.1 hypothetical protein H263_12369 [Brachyspira hampsonii 30599]MBW5380115.1 tripartite tricarboxylate transporter TctB family protein [Brachyspira hampsonii]MBW5409091.1 tripartite tricarboxylate transporter TctB family protein [Brachyspira hampsonii]OEJ17366.1 hypothetical protein A9496_00100 [Brachyspira hampsonii]
MTITTLSSIVTIAVGVVYTIMTFQLPDASIGRAAEPKIFPAILGIAFTLLGLILLIDDTIKNSKKDKKEKVQFSFGDNGKKILITIVNAVLYAVLFNVIGYVFATIIFLEIELLIFGGIKAWKVSTIVAVLFSIIAFLIFNVFLGIYLPRSPLGII